MLMKNAHLKVLVNRSKWTSNDPDEPAVATKHRWITRYSQNKPLFVKMIFSLSGHELQLNVC